MSDELNTDPRGAFPRLWAKHDPGIRAFVRASLPDPHDLAEVMQNVSVIAWKKFSDLEDVETGFGPWVSVIARYEILKSWFLNYKKPGKMVFYGYMNRESSIQLLKKAQEKWKPKN